MLEAIKLFFPPEGEYSTFEAAIDLRRNFKKPEEFSLGFFVKRWRWASRTRVRNHLLKMEKEGLIEIDRSGVPHKLNSTKKKKLVEEKPTCFSFEEFEFIYGEGRSIIDRDDSMRRFSKLNEEDRRLISEHLPLYIANTSASGSDGALHYRRHPKRYLSGKLWLVPIPGNVKPPVSESKIDSVVDYLINGFKLIEGGRARVKMEVEGDPQMLESLLDRIKKNIPRNDKKILHTLNEWRLLKKE